jgi:glutathione S-transferase
MLLYTCPFGTSFGGLGPLSHPCGRAGKALDDAGHRYEIKQVKGGTGMAWTWPARARDRAEVRELSGQRAVPILVLDDGGVIAGSGKIARWAAEHPALGAAPLAGEQGQ